MAKELISINKSDHTKGGIAGEIEVIEFIDFECPYCVNARFIVDQLIETFNGKIVFASRHFPQPEYHNRAVIMSCAAEAAANQNKFWEMHDQLFHHQNVIDPYKIYQIAEQMGLDSDLFHTHFNDPETKKKVLDDLEFGRSIGVTGTPTFFIDGQKHSGDWTYRSLYQVIDGILKSRES